MILYNPAPKPSASTAGIIPARPVVSGSELAEMYFRLSSQQRAVYRRDYALVDLAFSCGLRRAELHRLDLQDIDPQQGLVRVRGKYDKERLVPVGKRTLEVLMDYIYNVRPTFLKDGRTEAVFVAWTAGGGRMAVATINSTMKRLRKRYGLSRNLTSHALRRSFATGLIKNGAPLQDVSLMLGHASINTTGIYTRLMPADLKKCHRKYHPRG